MWSLAWILLMVSWKTRLHAVNFNAKKCLFFFLIFFLAIFMCRGIYSPSSTWKAYLLCIYFQYSFPGFIILEWMESREWVLSTLVGQMRPFDLLFGACSKHVSKRSCIWIFCFAGDEEYLSLNDVQIILRGVTQNPKYLKLPKIEPFSKGSQLSIVKESDTKKISYTEKKNFCTNLPLCGWPP